MRQIRKILRDKRGEGYIDVAVMVLCVMLVIALGVRLFPIFITKMQVDNFADELVREAEISGRVGRRDFEQAESLGGKNRNPPDCAVVKNRESAIK